MLELPRGDVVPPLLKSVAAVSEVTQPLEGAPRNQAQRPYRHREKAADAVADEDEQGGVEREPDETDRRHDAVE